MGRSVYGVLEFGSLLSYFSVLKLVQCCKYDTHRYFGDLFNELTPHHTHNTRYICHHNLNLPGVRLSNTKRNVLSTAIVLGRLGRFSEFYGYRERAHG